MCKYFCVFNKKWLKKQWKKVTILQCTSSKNRLSYRAKIFCEDTHNQHGALKKNRLIDICSGTRVMTIVKHCTFRRRHSNLFAPTVVLGSPRGSGFCKGEYTWKGMEMGRSVYEQPGTKVDRILSQQGGFQVSKGKRKGIKEE